MDVRSPHLLRDAGTPSLADRAQAVLRDEIAGGALANITAASQMWSAHRRDLVVPEMTRRLVAEVGGLLDTVLDLLAPPPRSPAASPLPGPVGQDRAPQRERQPAGPVPVLRARRPAPPGGTAEIRTSLQNDGPDPVEIGFLWSDLVGEPAGRIRASRLRLVPGRVRVPAGALADLTIGLDVPDDARPGLYHVLLRATGRAESCALLTFPVGLDVGLEASIAM
ncbi:COG1470 family protein [Geodermatophilus maliterrae]|uniref:Ig-like domain-containing protein n=1 Tax=Geodermatophilus maliterrae TaxID=3162531 RepID=A0ABV3XJR7_9ACTN